MTGLIGGQIYSHYGTTRLVLPTIERRHPADRGTCILFLGRSFRSTSSETSTYCHRTTDRRDYWGNGAISAITKALRCNSAFLTFSYIIDNLKPVLSHALYDQYTGRRDGRSGLISMHTRLLSLGFVILRFYLTIERHRNGIGEG